MDMTLLPELSLDPFPTKSFFCNAFAADLEKERNVMSSGNMSSCCPQKALWSPLCAVCVGASPVPRGRPVYYVVSHILMRISPRVAHSAHMRGDECATPQCVDVQGGE